MMSSSITDEVLALVLAGGQGGRLRPLTARRAKPALPFAGVYRLIDFALSNLVNSRVRDVWVVEQFESNSINDHLLNGRPWDLDRNRGGLRIFAPHVKGDSDDDGFHQGNADAIWRNARYIREFAPKLLVVMSADHIYRLDVRPVLEAHRDTGATVTMVTTQVPAESATRYGTLKTDNKGRVNFWDYKPDEPQSGTVTTKSLFTQPISCSMSWSIWRTKPRNAAKIRMTRVLCKTSGMSCCLNWCNKVTRGLGRWTATGVM
jgi:glucose-1-phosphate adenylyltransferase